jgi:hypothetical protein
MKRAPANDEENYGAEHADVARDLNNLAVLLQATNRLEDAEPLMRRALAINETSYGTAHPRVAGDLNNLAVLLQATNRLGDAEPLMRRVLFILLAFTRVTGHLHPHMKQACVNYRTLLKAMDLSNEDVGQRLLSLGEDAGFDAGTYRPLLAELLSS